MKLKEGLGLLLGRILGSFIRKPKQKLKDVLADSAEATVTDMVADGLEKRGIDLGDVSQETEGRTP